VSGGRADDPMGGSRGGSGARPPLTASGGRAGDPLGGGQSDRPPLVPTDGEPASADDRGRLEPGDRESRLIGLEEAAAMVEDGMTVGLSGFAHQNPPMAIVRALIRRGVRGLTLVCGPTAGFETDLLVGSGCVHKVVAAGVAMEQVAAIAPAFRHRYELGEVQMWECDECIWYVGLQAAAWGVPYLLWPGGVGSSLPELNPDLVEVREGDRTFLRVPPIRPDIVFIHAAEADRFGNVRECPDAYLGRSFAERALAAACAGPVVASVERVIDNEEVVAAPEWTLVHGAWVVEAPWGAHPGGVSGRYVPDLRHQAAYARAARALAGGDPCPYARYIAQWIDATARAGTYIEAVGREALRGLQTVHHS